MSFQHKVLNFKWSGRLIALLGYGGEMLDTVHADLGNQETGMVWGDVVHWHEPLRSPPVEQADSHVQCALEIPQQGS